jgi:hypothetical protein
MLYKDFDDASLVNVCFMCVGDEFLRQSVRSDGKETECSYCKNVRSCFSLAGIGDQVHEVLNEQFYLTSSEPDGLDYMLAKDGLWNREGDPVAEVIADIGGFDEEIAEDIRAYLSDQHGYSEVKDGGEDPYADDAQYDARGPDDQNLRDTWESFCQQIRWRSRYFSEYVEISLDNIFGDLESLSTVKGASIIQVITPSDINRYVFRARVAFSQSELQDILKYPAKQLGAPPSRLARAGRMNAAGISVFYGALDVDTCVAEIRPPVGGMVAVCRFELIRPIHILDLDALDQVYVEGSHFDPDFAMRRARAAFLGRLVREISRPVMPSDEVFQYLPTQFVAEYLATKSSPSLDGIIFKSSQTGDAGKNLVLFNHASLAEPDDTLPSTTFDFMMGSGPDDDFDPTIVVFEKVEDVPPTLNSSSSAKSSVSIPARDEAWLAGRKPALRLDKESVRVLLMSGVRYSYSEHGVMRIRSKKEGGDVI